MSPELKEFEVPALQLEPQDRATLAEHLIASLDEMDASENERLWLGEADRRYQEYKKGNISARTADDVLRDARSAIQCAVGGGRCGRCQSYGRCPVGVSPIF